ncbi:MAG TPA: hypothetical protein VKV57_09475 [bacterium]|nr:hypothetical protein [bacterium]
MEDLTRRTLEWKESHPLKQWRRRKGYAPQQAALVLDFPEARLLNLEVGDPPTDDEMKTITQRTGITQAQWTVWERAVPRGRAVPPQG